MRPLMNPITIAFNVIRVGYHRSSQVGYALIFCVSWSVVQAIIQNALLQWNAVCYVADNYGDELYSQCRH